MKNNIEVKKLNDFFIRYFFGLEGHEDLLLSFINAIMIDSNFATFVSVEIINPFNLSEKANNKESIVDLKAVTEDGIIVIIEIQLCGNMDFVKRIFYYISKNIVNELKEGEDYKKLPRIISINLLNFNLDFGDEGKPHRCFKLIDMKNHGIDLDFIQMHINRSEEVY